tara:strand:- start:340 stop:849 length:510 start_codon:yes stop_codon:yes gene_type:complete
MEQNTENQIEFKDRIISFYKINKNKIKIFLLILIILIISIFFIEISKSKKNEKISEKYVSAGVLYLENKNDQAKKIYEEILKSKNSFYTMLALSDILEKNLEQDKEKMITYFDKVEKLQKTKEQKDILIIKKALYLTKYSDEDEANKLLKELINSNSKLKDLAEEILSK